jgi:hypothetical protein
VGQDFRVGFGLELVSGLDETGFKAVIILDDAVMHHGDPAALVEMGMGVFVRGRAVGCPAGVADAQEAGERLEQELVGQAIVDFALPFDPMELPVLEHGDAGAIIASVFQTAQSLQDDGSRRLFADVTDNATHKSDLCFFRMPLALARLLR